ncbi:MAG: CotH kinase family protein [Verrucomicrobiales bacterium]|nr:CotH kinase family protein [Verrucomicrobiales bacterium]
MDHRPISWYRIRHVSAPSRRAPRTISPTPWLLLAILACFALTATASPVISEFLANNQSGLRDEDGEFSDWIEIHNPDSLPVSLAGWSLTDDPALPAKWRFPETILAPNAYLVLFASGKDRTNTPAFLHANFRLDAAGEYLALFPPDGTTAATEFRPAYPPQAADISYGTPSNGGVQDLLSGQPAIYLVPSSAQDLDPTWAQPTGSGSTLWSVATGLGIGFDAAGTSVGGDTNLARAGTAQQTSTGFDFGAELAIDGDLASFTHTESDDNASAWWVDLGATYEIRKVIVHNRSNCCGSRLRDITINLLAQDGATVVWSSGLLNPENALDDPASLTVDLLDLADGPVSARTIRISRTPDPDLSGSGGAGNADEDNVLSLGEVEVFGVESLSFAPRLRTDLTAAMRGRNSSAFLRIPFELESLDDWQSLQLSLWFNDGAVVHLNGQVIAEFNAPAQPAWNAAAVSKRPKAASLTPVLLDLRNHRAALVPGTNWLAIQGLNASAADEDFLIDARLDASSNAGSFLAFLDRPTPGAVNDAGWNLGHVADTRFSTDRGFIDQPFELAITCATEGAQIRYTTNGAAPTETTGLIYQAPLSIRRSTVVRAAAFLADHRPSNVDTHSYLFLRDTIAQPAAPSGFPASWAGVAADYAMDPRITQSAAFGPLMTNALVHLPTLSVVTDNDNLFGGSRGIYANPERTGVTWERPISLEWISPEGAGELQVDCGLRVQGGYFRNRNVTQKHSLRLLFKDEYGPGRLKYDVFREFGAAREFDTLVLRAGANDGYAWDAARDTEQFIRDEFGRRLYLAMGQPSVRGRFVHVYLNGLYWGIYDLTERPAEDFSATYLGGAPEDWDANNAGEVKNGSIDAWNAFIGRARTATTLADYQRLKGLNADGSPNASFTNYLDAPNYIDYMVVNMWGGNWDWPNKNFWFGRQRDGSAGGFKFYLWDFENTMGNNRDRSPLSMVSPRSDIASSWVGEPHSRLKALAEYRLEFADRVQKHFFGQGVLTPAALVERYRALAQDFEPAVVAETARWGDDNLNPPQDLTDWQRERDWLLNSYLPQRTAVVLDQFKRQGLYPATAAPTLTPSGGSITPGLTLNLAASAPEVFYTTNGLDPRLPGGEIRPGAIRLALATNSTPAPNPDLVRSGHTWRYLADGTDPTTAWRDPSFDDSRWPSGPSPLGYGDGDEATVVPFVDANATTAGVQKNATTFFRTSFDVVATNGFSGLSLSLTYDDAAAVFLNGVEILRTDNLPANAAFNTYATAGSSDNAVASRSDIPAGLLRIGQNVLAVEIRQSDATSSDISFDLELAGTVASGGGSGSSAPLQLTGPATLKARARQGTVWSALVEAIYTFDSVPASTNNLVISQFCYRPPNPTSPAEEAISRDRDDYEYLELLNVGPRTVDLAGVGFTEGVLYQFQSGQTLAPGARLLLVSHRPAFEARYGPRADIAGEYQGRLDNGGERITCVDAAGALLRSFNYLDTYPWPALATSDGFAVVLMRPDTLPDHHRPQSWRISAQPGGTPGRSDATRFTGDPDADLNGNGRADLLDYAFGRGLPEAEGRLVARLAWMAMVEADSVPILQVEYPRNRQADDLDFILEVADSVAGPWIGDLPTTWIGETQLAEGISRRVYLLQQPMTESARFVRLRIARVP